MNIEELNLHGSLLEGVHLGPNRELALDVFLPDVTTTPKRAASQLGVRLAIRFTAIENLSNVERFFFGGPLKGRGDYLDEIVAFCRTRVGWSLELGQRGRVAIRTGDKPTVEREAG
jgi:hypothetical protein